MKRALFYIFFILPTFEMSPPKSVPLSVWQRYLCGGPLGGPGRLRPTTQHEVVNVAVVVGVADHHWPVELGQQLVLAEEVWPDVVSGEEAATHVEGVGVLLVALIATIVVAFRRLSALQSSTFGPRSAALSPEAASAALLPRHDLQTPEQPLHLPPVLVSVQHLVILAHPPVPPAASLVSPPPIAPLQLRLCVAAHQTPQAAVSAIFSDL